MASASMPHASVKAGCTLAFCPAPDRRSGGHETSNGNGYDDSSDPTGAGFMHIRLREATSPGPHRGRICGAIEKFPNCFKGKKGTVSCAQAGMTVFPTPAGSPQIVPNPTATAVLIQRATLNQRSEVVGRVSLKGVTRRLHGMSVTLRLSRPTGK